MAQQIPLAQFGLEEAVEQQMVIWLENLTTQFTGQQSDGQQPVVKVASLWNKLQTPEYPFIGVRAHMPTWEPTNLGDFESYDDTGAPIYAKMNEVLVNLHIESLEYRQILRLYSFLQMHLEFGYDSQAYAQTLQYESWLSQIRNWGLLINGWTSSPVIPVRQTDIPDNNEPSHFPRTDVFTIFERDINLNCILNTRVTLSPAQPIAEITENLTIILPAP